MRHPVIISHQPHHHLSLCAHQHLNIEQGSFEVRLGNASLLLIGSTALRRRKTASVLALAVPSSETKMSVRLLHLISRSNRQKDPPQLPPVAFCWYQALLFTQPERTGENPAAATVGKRLVCANPRQHTGREHMDLMTHCEDTWEFQSCPFRPSFFFFQILKWLQTWLIQTYL